MKNESDLIFKEIKTEKFRTYEWESGKKITIESPTHLNVSANGGHRILDLAGRSHYIPSGWIHLYWEVHEDCPNFVI